MAGGREGVNTYPVTEPERPPAIGIAALSATWHGPWPRRTASRQPTVASECPIANDNHHRGRDPKPAPKQSTVVFHIPAEARQRRCRACRRWRFRDADVSVGTR